jgi:hypothetical protein
MKNNATTAEREAPAPQKLDPKMADLMKQAEAAGSPGTPHKALEPLVGEWDAEVSCWMDPDGPPLVSQATAKTTWILNGRFLQEEFHGEFMGKPFSGISLTGYDNLNNKYQSVWMDDSHTSMFTSQGSTEGGGKTITLEGRMDCVMTGQKNKLVRQIHRILSHDKHTFEMHDPSKGGDSKTMEITYTRRK